MTSKATRGRPQLSSQKELLLHTYDLLLVSQARIFTLACSSHAMASAEITTRQKLLFLDDILSFSIAARRLIELTGLRSFANRQFLSMRKIIFAEGEIEIVLPNDVQKIGFLSFISNVIHSRFIDLLTSRFDLAYLKPMNDDDFVSLYYRFVEIDESARWAEFSVTPSVFVVPDKGTPSLIGLKDLIETSAKISEKITDVCRDSKIFLELEFRGAN